MPELRRYRQALEGRRAAVYTGGAFKAFSLVRSLRTLGMKTVLVGSQTGNREDYELLRELCDEGTILVDDTNPLELSRFVQEKEVDLFIGGVKERPIAYKLGIGFCDHNHERKVALAGFEGMLNFAREVHASVMSPVWKLVPRRRRTPHDRCCNESRPDAAKAVTRNACKLCAPLGACLAFRGVEGAVPFLHGSQGCATYIRRYMISHFKEPLDIASSNFGETTAIFGGLENLREGLANVIRQYAPRLIGIASTCLAETIGDDVAFYLRQIAAETSGPLPELVHVSTPSYSGTHVEGFHATVYALVETLAEPGPRHGAINVLPGMVSPADLRYLKDMVSDFGLEPIMLPDYSSTLDGPIWSEYQRIPPGGTPIEAIRRMGSARATHRVRLHAGPLAHGRGTARRAIRRAALRIAAYRWASRKPTGSSKCSANWRDGPCRRRMSEERGRLIDSYVDAHKYVFGKRAVLYGEQDLVVGLASLLAEIGIVPALCASGGKTGRLREQIVAAEPDLHRRCHGARRRGLLRDRSPRRRCSTSIWPSATARATALRGNCRYRWFAWAFPFTTAWTGRGCCTSDIAAPNSCSIGSSMR